MTGSNIMTTRLKNEIDLLNRHLQILAALSQSKTPLGILRLSDMLNLSPHKIRYSLRILEQYGLIMPSTQGAVLKGNIKEFTEELISDLAEIKDDATDVYTHLQKFRD